MIMTETLDFRHFMEYLQKCLTNQQCDAENMFSVMLFSELLVTRAIRATTNKLNKKYLWAHSNRKCLKWSVTLENAYVGRLFRYVLV